MSDRYWNEPVKWDNWCEQMGLRHKVFCGSMFDVMEDHDDLVAPRDRLWCLIEATPNLDWLLLTKRPENFAHFLPDEWMRGYMPGNVWVGATVENQDVMEDRVKSLALVPAPVRFISCEPMLGPVDFGLPGVLPHVALPEYSPVYDTLNWIIVGAESGPSRRPFDPDWARAVRDQCVEWGVPFFFKQEIGPSGKKIELPGLDGRVWAQFPRNM